MAIRVTLIALATLLMSIVNRQVPQTSVPSTQHILMELALPVFILLFVVFCIFLNRRMAKEKQWIGSR